MEFVDIKTKFFNPNTLPIADFLESLFCKEHVEISSVVFDGVDLQCDKDYLPKLLNVNEVEISNSEINLKDLKVKLDMLFSLKVTSSKLEFPRGNTMFEKVSKL